MINRNVTKYLLASSMLVFTIASTATAQVPCSRIGDYLSNTCSKFPSATLCSELTRVYSIECDLKCPPSVETFLASSQDRVSIPVEAQDPNGAWNEETGISGYLGSSYFTWRGSNQFSNPTHNNGENVYRIRVATPGTYLLRARNYHDNPDPTEENDAWMKVKTATNIGQYTDQYIKGFHNSSLGSWQTEFRWDFGEGEPQPLANFVVTPLDIILGGIVEIHLKGRSQGFSVDHLYIGLSAPNGQDSPSGWATVANSDIELTCQE